MNTLPRYFVVKVHYGYQIVTWEDIYEEAEYHGYSSNDLIGCRTYTADSGNVVVKMDV